LLTKEEYYNLQIYLIKGKGALSMKLTKTRLKQIIKEELQKVLSEERSMEFSDEEGTQATVSLSPRAALRKLSQKHGGVRGILKLDRNDPDRVAYRKAYLARKSGKSTVELPAPALSKPKPRSRHSASDMTKDIESMMAQQSAKSAARVAAAKKDLGGYGKATPPLDPPSKLDKQLASTLSKDFTKSDPTAMAGIKIVDDPDTIGRAAATTAAERENPLGRTSGPGRRPPRRYADPAKVKPVR
jgi:hypothetical protein